MRLFTQTSRVAAFVLGIIVITMTMRGRIEFQFTRKMQKFDRKSASFSVTEGIAQWLGLALLRASLQKEKEQHVENRHGSALG
jgi:hypothetical protein